MAYTTNENFVMEELSGSKEKQQSKNDDTKDYIDSVKDYIKSFFV